MSRVRGVRHVIEEQSLDILKGKFTKRQFMLDICAVKMLPHAHHTSEGILDLVSLCYACLWVLYAMRQNRPVFS